MAAQLDVVFLVAPVSGRPPEDQGQEAHRLLAHQVALAEQDLAHPLAMAAPLVRAAPACRPLAKGAKGNKA